MDKKENLMRYMFDLIKMAAPYVKWEHFKTAGVEDVITLYKKNRPRGTYLSDLMVLLGDNHELIEKVKEIGNSPEEFKTITVEAAMEKLFKDEDDE